MMKNRKMRKKELVKKVQSKFNRLLSSRRNEIRKRLFGLNGRLFYNPFTCALCGHNHTKGYVYNDGAEEYEICKFCNDSLFRKHDYIKILYTPMGNKR